MTAALTDASQETIILASKRVDIETEIHPIPGHCLRRSYRPWDSKHISTARVGNQYTKRTLSHRQTGERSEHLPFMEKILTVNSRLSCSTFRDSFTNKEGHLPYGQSVSNNLERILTRQSHSEM